MNSRMARGWVRDEDDMHDGALVSLVSCRNENDDEANALPDNYHANTQKEIQISFVSHRQVM